MFFKNWKEDEKSDLSILLEMRQLNLEDKTLKFFDSDKIIKFI